MKLKIVRPDEIQKMRPNERIQFFKMCPNEMRPLKCIFSKGRRCTNNKSKCKARVRTDGESKVVMSAMSEHNHDMNGREIELKQLRVMAKRKASDDILARRSKINVHYTYLDYVYLYANVPN
jgi:aspartyl/asparaginyl-tRNA synthetase